MLLYHSAVFIYVLWLCL